MNRIRKEDAILAAVDFQTRLMPAMAEKERLEETTVRCIKGLKVLGIPAIVTQQYTKGLGPTIDSVAEALGDFDPIDKITFSAMGEPEFVRQLTASGKKTVLLTGIEAHICVQQTALDLLDKGYQVCVIADCLASRTEENKQYSLQRMAAAGAVITTYEAILYELLGSAKADGFKAISALVK